jgi:hypothetical protein
MDVALRRALIAAARAFAGELEHGLAAHEAGAEPPAPGSTQSMLEVLRSLAGINDSQQRGASREEMRRISQRAGMDPRGMAGYYRAKLLERRDDDTRWISELGRERLGALSGTHPLDET